MRFGSTAKVLAKCKVKCYRISECLRAPRHALHDPPPPTPTSPTPIPDPYRPVLGGCGLLSRGCSVSALQQHVGLARTFSMLLMSARLSAGHAQAQAPLAQCCLMPSQSTIQEKSSYCPLLHMGFVDPKNSSLSCDPSQPQLHEPCECIHTMRFGSTAKVLLKCKLKYYRISECIHVM